MEGLKTRAFVLAGLFLVAAGFNLTASRQAHGPRKTETWMEARAPDVVSGMSYFRGGDNPAQSYRMDKITYNMLAPFGIVARDYVGKDGKNFDVVLIASETRASFHDPRICFSGQGWILNDQNTVEVPTKSRGVVPVTLASMNGQGKKNQLAAFFYRGPSGFHATTISLKFDMFFQKLLRKPGVEGVFYRFIPQFDGCTEEELKSFIAEYLEASKESSGGYF